MNEWIKCEEELPPHDGIYLISNDPSKDFIGGASYDGIGFFIYPAYRTPVYWKHTSFNKKYGKQK